MIRVTGSKYTQLLIRNVSTLKQLISPKDDFSGIWIEAERTTETHFISSSHAGLVGRERRTTKVIRHVFHKLKPIWMALNTYPIELLPTPPSSPHLADGTASTGN